jgi:hypothetical protein
MGLSDRLEYAFDRVHGRQAVRDLRHEMKTSLLLLNPKTEVQTTNGTNNHE